MDMERPASSVQELVNSELFWANYKVIKNSEHAGIKINTEST
jgi:hypothetical protein